MNTTHAAPTAAPTARKGKNTKLKIIAGTVLALAVLGLAGKAMGGSEADASAPTTPAAPPSVSMQAPAPVAPVAPAPVEAPAPVAPAPVEAPAPAPAPAPVEEAPAPALVPMPDVVGMNLQAAQDKMQEAGVFFSRSEDATGAGRLQINDSNWTVVAQSPAAGELIGEGDALLSVTKNTDN